MLHIYEGIGITIIKLESFILNQATGNSKAMEYYYDQWEKEMFRSFVKYTNFNLAYFNNFLKSSYKVHSIKAFLESSEVKIRPTPIEIFNIIGDTVEDFLKRYSI